MVLSEEDCNPSSSFSFRENRMFRKGNCLALVAVLFLICPLAMSYDFNRLCINSGQYLYLATGNHTSRDRGGGKYFPSFSHIASTPDAAGNYPWKIKGWSWSGMQYIGCYGPAWRWVSLLQKSKNNPYSTQMSFSYPINYFNGAVSPINPPLNVNYGPVPSSITKLSTVPSGFGGAGLNMCYPSSYQGFDSYLNIIAAGDANWSIPSTAPYYCFHFAFVFPSTDPLLLESSYSIWEYVWKNTGPYMQYIVHAKDLDCTSALGGNKGKNYSLIGGFPDAPHWEHRPNDGTGANFEWTMALLVEDAVCIPANTCDCFWSPFEEFDLGSGTITPNLSSGEFAMQAMYESYAQEGHTYCLLASMPSLSSPVIYGCNKYRVPGWDTLTDFFAGLWTVWAATVEPGYPGILLRPVVGGHSIQVPAGHVPSLVGSEVIFYGFDRDHGPPTAGYMVTFF